MPSHEERARELVERNPSVRAAQLTDERSNRLLQEAIASALRTGEMEAYERAAKVAETAEIERLRARVVELEGALLPFAEAARAIGNDPGPVRFYTDKGYREIEREKLDVARSVLSGTPSERGGAAYRAMINAVPKPEGA